MANRRYITLETAPELLGKTVDCFKRMWHYYPLKVIQMRKDGQFFIGCRGSGAVSGLQTSLQRSALHTSSVAFLELGSNSEMRER